MEISSQELDDLDSAYPIVPKNVPKKATKPKQDSLAKQWSYTINNYTTKNHIPDEDCKYRIQGYEVGEKGTPHIQGYVWLNKEIRWTAFQKMYPTITHFEKSKGNPYQNFEYCSKDGDFEEVGVRPKKPKNMLKSDEVFTEAINKPTVREGLQVIKEKRPRDLLIHGEAIERNLKKIKLAPYVREYEPNQFNIPLQSLTKSTLLTGGSGIGKSHYAAAHFINPLICTHMDNLKQLSPDHDGIIFDDMSFKHYPKEAVIHLLDTEFVRTLNVRYGTVTIPAHTKKIFTHNNENPFYNDDIEEEQRKAIERRLSRVVLIGKLFKVVDT